MSSQITSFLGNSVVKPANAQGAGNVSWIPGLGRFPGAGNGNTSIFLPGAFYGQRSLAGYSPCGRKESDMTE